MWHCWVLLSSQWFTTIGYWVHNIVTQHCSNNWWATKKLSHIELLRTEKWLYLHCCCNEITYFGDHGQLPTIVFRTEVCTDWRAPWAFIASLTLPKCAVGRSRRYRPGGGSGGTLLLLLGDRHWALKGGYTDGRSTSWFVEWCYAAWRTYVCIYLSR